MKKTLIVTLLVLLIIPIIPCQAQKCTKDDIKIIEWHWEKRNLTTWIIGELQNNCTQPTSVKLQIIVRDENGTLIDSSDFFVAGVNIQPGERWPIKYPATTKSNFKTIELRIIELVTW